MVSKRIKLIASLLDYNDCVLDVGTDHALLPIYVQKNNIAKLIHGSDISLGALNQAKNNIIKYHFDDKIELFISDGLKAIDISKYNTLVICGMGYFTIKDILNNSDLKNINKLIIQTNNHYKELRIYINEIGYKIISENYICDYNKDYLIFSIAKGKQVLSNIEINCGIYSINNKEFYKKQINKLEEINKHISTDMFKKHENNELINQYKEYLSK